MKGIAESTTKETSGAKTINSDQVARVINQYDYDEDEVYELSELFKVLGDSTRIKILGCLTITEMCVSDISQFLGMTQSAISHQLRKMKMHRLVKSRRDGKVIYYALDDEHVREIITSGFEHVQE